jgi:preprotein translocase subunit SecA
MLQKINVPHEVLNAKNHAREAEIIAKAGQKGAVTIATNMAGRGTDIKLGEGVKELGGLCVLGTERHEARRIDNQLRGRSGRQGDPGVSQFFVSLEDELMVRFGTDRIKSLMQTAGFTDQPIRSGLFTGSIESAQRRVEGNNFDIRKRLLQFDNVMNEHREIIYRKRNEILDEESIHLKVLQSFRNYINDVVIIYVNDTDKKYDELLNNINNNLIRTKKLKKSTIENKNTTELSEIIFDIISKEYEDKISKFPVEVINEFEKAFSLRVIDMNWMNHINSMEHLREGVNLRGYANEDPLQAYIKEGYQVFDKLMAKISEETSVYLIRAEIKLNIERKQVEKPIANSGEEKKSIATNKNKKVGRNDPCPCGSGKKYKQCCGK